MPLALGPACRPSGTALAPRRLPAHWHSYVTSVQPHFNAMHTPYTMCHAVRTTPCTQAMHPYSTLGGMFQVLALTDRAVGHLSTLPPRPPHVHACYIAGARGPMVCDSIRTAEQNSKALLHYIRRPPPSSATTGTSDGMVGTDADGDTQNNRAGGGGDYKHHNCTAITQADCLCDPSPEAQQQHVCPDPLFPQISHLQQVNASDASPVLNAHERTALAMIMADDRLLWLCFMLTCALG